MKDDFTLIDLSSQAKAVESILGGMTIDEKPAWLSAHGEVEAIQMSNPEFPQTYYFLSCGDIETPFYFYEGKLIPPSHVGHHFPN